MASPRHEDDDETFDASDDGGTPHVDDLDEAILYAAQLDELAAAGFHETPESEA